MVLRVMKLLSFLLLFIFCFFRTNAQSLDYASIDAYVLTIDAKTPAALSKKLTAPYKTDAEKVRAIFRWITENIAYNTIVYQKSIRSLTKKYASIIDEDTSSSLPPLNERVAQLVLQRRVAVCDGYARLFKTLCDYAGIRSEIIFGYARTNNGRSGRRFNSNHTWNAVNISNTWYLLDATWASGYITFGDSFIKHFNESYYLTPPELFIQDHYPELMFWSLLSSMPTFREFQSSPFKNQAFLKFKVQSFKPASGIIEASIGDTLEFELETGEEIRKFFASANPYFEIGIWPYISSIPIQTPTFDRQGNKVFFKYVLTSPHTNQLHIVLNDQVILQYKVQVKNHLTIK
jgi:transglutaminase/protease-like cytokinesis protein 3